ncbi:DUF4178 domain-containing protein [Sphingomonas baiyangensis]|uniref:DUF4178 domain-containing protein n=1 Tax=Sphingomonas baiyangensis TaxID=2572576 RepID=A0A4U1L801_9SPHN|nr:DUF4178 domain-containing protein [Sphingomonas baiyangensis]TKD52894.1 DUF4178 domain-containing protein [Sphingomonas baiyangensis]
MAEADTLSPPQAPAATAITCPSCGGTVAIRAAGHSVTVACEYCASILDVSEPAVKLVVEHHRRRAALDIPLGTRGTLKGVEWEVVGWMARSEGGAYPWEEYLLFNPYEGYRWLIYNRGGWSFGEQLTVVPGGGWGGLELDGAHYKHFFAEGTAQVDRVVGEFYWRVKQGDTVRTDDWVRPGYMLSREADDREISWSRSEWIDAKTVEAAFGIRTESGPWPPLPHQPSPHVAWLKQALVIAGIAALAIIAAAMFAGGSRTLAEQTLTIARDGNDQSATLGPITLRRPYQPVSVRAEVPSLSNGWVDLEYTLVDRATQRAFNTYKAAERYSGRDSDGDWSEGSRRTTADFASVPAGTYDLVVDYKGNNWLGAQSIGDWRNAAFAPEMRITVTSGGAPFGVALLALILIGVPVLFGAIRHAAFEQARMGESDFAPTSSEDDD